MTRIVARCFSTHIEGWLERAAAEVGLEPGIGGGEIADHGGGDRPGSKRHAVAALRRISVGSQGEVIVATPQARAHGQIE
jgi:hypothetical protein